MLNNNKDDFLQDLKLKLQVLRYSKNTIKIYTHYCEEFLISITKSPSKLSSSDFQNYINTYNFTSGSQQNQIISSIKFFYEKVLSKKYNKISFTRPRKEEKLPNIIPEEHLKECLGKITNLKHKAMLTLAYSVGLRSGDVLNLKLSDLSSKSMQIKVVNGKGCKDAYLPLYDNVFNVVAQYYRNEKKKPTEYLFEGQFGGKYSNSSLNQITKKYIGKEYHFHNLRHSCATHLLNKGVDISFIQKMLRHKDVKTTMIYLKISTQDLKSLPQLV